MPPGLAVEKLNSIRPSCNPLPARLFSVCRGCTPARQSVLGMGMENNEGNTQLPPKALSRLLTRAHDLNGSLETIVLAAYLLGNANLEGEHKKWAQMIDAAARDAARVHHEMHEILRGIREAPLSDVVLGRQPFH